MLQTCVSFPQNPNVQFLLQTTSTPPSSSSLPNLTSSSPASGVSLLPVRSVRISTPFLLSCAAFRNTATTGDNKSRPVIRWKDIYNKVWLLENSGNGISGVLNQCEIDGKTFEKHELFVFVKNLRKFRRYNYALEVFDWMSNRPERFDLFNSSDMAVKLDLIAKVHGISSAEDFFTRIPDDKKERRLYGALLNAYVEANSKERAEVLMDKMRKEGLASFPLSFNRMMTMYMKLKEYNKVEEIVSDMKRCKIRLDLYSYNIWLYARGSQGSIIGLEEVFQELEQNQYVFPDWTTFSSMATLYLSLGKLEKAKACMKSLEEKLDGENRSPYHYLLNLYGRVGEKEEVYRVWNMYKSKFEMMTNWGYHSMVHSLVQVGDIEGAEHFYNEWFTVKSAYDARISNILLQWYVKEGLFEKVESFFAHMEQGGGKMIASTWEILAEYHIKQRRVSDALNCFRQAKSTGYWRPRSAKLLPFLELCEQESDESCKEEMIRLLREMGFSYDELPKSDPDDETGWSGNIDSEMLLSVT
ncbi:uncharacterized protein [Phyllobates terribilis]|uniref:uncharacterized protein n=1 Tax=Phyllobates terribilis TaxID=111132 RepID=UPI003CCAD5B5